MSKQSNKKVYKNNQRKPKTQASNVNGAIKSKAGANADNASAANSARNSSANNASTKAINPATKNVMTSSASSHSPKNDAKNKPLNRSANAKNAANIAKSNSHETGSVAMGKSAEKSGANASNSAEKSGANANSSMAKTAGNAKAVSKGMNARAKGSRTKMAANYNAAALDEAKTNKDAHLKAANGQKNQTNDFTDTKQRHITKRNTPTDAWLWAIIIIGGVLLAGGLATLLGGQMFNFRAHTLPQGVVPKIVFPIAWAAIYIMLGVSAFLAFLSPNQNAQTRRGDIIWFSINLFFNIMWPLFFFRLDSLIISTIICGIVLVTAIITNYRFYYRNLAAGILYSIYTLWLMYAFYLNLGICLLNA